MKLLILLLVFSCTQIKLNNSSTSIPYIQECWSTKDVACIKKYFGSPSEETKDHISYSQDQTPTLKVFVSGQKIESIHYWLVDPKYANRESLKILLPSDDWNSEAIPEQNPHVVNLAVVNFSLKRGASFLTYKLDTENKVRMVYWGGNYKDIEI
jgi:hypothetical protein